ncbi:MAG: EcsC family protein [Rhodothermales bacterium]
MPPSIDPSSLSPYEQEALRGIAVWKRPDQAWWERAAAAVQRSLDDVGDQLRRIPGVDWTIDNVVAGLLKVLNEITQDLVWRDAIYRDFQRLGHDDVRDIDAVARLDLRTIDEALDGLSAKYLGLAAVEGTATGLAGAAGILPDVVALVALNLRAAGEYATYYGFDISTPEERLYALSILDAAALPATERHQAEARLNEAHENVARTKTTRTINSVVVGGTLGAAARSIALRLTRSKLLQFMPVAGALLAGGFNSLYTRTVCDAAFHLYRERFLNRKYERRVEGEWGESR